jgi:hypothetical protein
MYSNQRGCGCVLIELSIYAPLCPERVALNRSKASGLFDCGTICDPPFTIVKRMPE